MTIQDLFKERGPRARVLVEVNPVARNWAPARAWLGLIACCSSNPTRVGLEAHPRANFMAVYRSESFPLVVPFVLRGKLPAVAAMQTLLFRDPRPLLDTLGTAFFREAPQCPGVYLMRDVRETVLYVGKAKNLRKRLGSYRVANPDRMPRRHLRMLRAVVRIELEEYPDERSALARESELLLKLRPRFNRAGTWPAPPLFLVWRENAEKLELAVSETPEADWEAFGPLGSMARLARNAIARLIWCMIHPNLGPSRMPLGWMHGQFQSITCIRTQSSTIKTGAWLRRLCSGESQEFIEWVRASVPNHLHPFDKTSIEADLEFLTEFLSLARTKNMALKIRA